MAGKKGPRHQHSRQGLHALITTQSGPSTPFPKISNAKKSMRLEVQVGNWSEQWGSRVGGGGPGGTAPARQAAPTWRDERLSEGCT